ncbi:MAG: DUF167 domain-containing protein [Solirubrobacterales bacterium]
MPSTWLQSVADGVTIDVKVIPKAAREQIGPVRSDRLLIKVTAPPEDGKANAAVCSLLAKRLGVSKTSVGVEAGATARSKRLHARGVSANSAQTLLLRDHVG